MMILLYLLPWVFFCCGIQYVVVQVNQFLINSIDAKFSVTKVIVLSRNLSITSKDKIDLQNSRVYKNSGSSCSCLCTCNFLSNSDTFGIRNLIFTFFYLNLNYLDLMPCKISVLSQKLITQWKTWRNLITQWKISCLCAIEWKC